MKLTINQWKKLLELAERDYCEKKKIYDERRKVWTSLGHDDWEIDKKYLLVERERKQAAYELLQALKTQTI